MAILSQGPEVQSALVDDEKARPLDAPTPQSKLISVEDVFYLLAAIIAFGLILYLLGLSIVQQFRDAESRSAATANKAYIQGILDPLVTELAEEGTLTSAHNDRVKEVLGNTSLGKHLIGLVIWDLKGEVAFTTLEGRFEDALAGEEFHAALNGGIGIELHLENVENPGVSIPVPYFEVYVPLYGANSTTPVAIGEVYTDATAMLEEMASAEATVWWSLGGGLLGLSALAFIAMLLRSRLAHQLEVAQNLANLNKHYRERAERERIAATQSNEQLLNVLGAEIHDGPVQMLSLLMLTLGRGDEPPPKNFAMDKRDLAEHIMSDLRAISGGLILPEIRNLSLSNALRLAVTRHQKMTGDKIVADVAHLPTRVDAGLAICLYRFVQEGLRNSYKYASPGGVTVVATADDKTIDITISDQDTKADTPKSSLTKYSGLGLQGIRNRLAVYGGVISLTDNDRGGKDLHLTVELLPQ